MNDEEREWNIIEAQMGWKVILYPMIALISKEFGLSVIEVSFDANEISKEISLGFAKICKIIVCLGTR